MIKTVCDNCGAIIPRGTNTSRSQYSYTQLKDDGWDGWRLKYEFLRQVPIQESVPLVTHEVHSDLCESCTTVMAFAFYVASTTGGVGTLK